MRIAFCISGHMRNFDKISEFYYRFKNMIASFGTIDTFVCTWNRLNTNQSWSAAHGLSDPNSANKIVSYDDIKRTYQTDNIEIINEDFFASEYSPLYLSFLTNMKYNWDSRGIHNNIPHSIKTAYLIYRCNLLKSLREFEIGKKYDLVFRLRPDSIYYIDSFGDLFDNILSDKLYTTFFDHRPYGDFGRFAFGSSNIMNIYSNSYLRTSQVFDKNIFGDPEKIYYETIIDLIKKDNIIYLPNFVFLVSEINGSHLR